MKNNLKILGHGFCEEHAQLVNTYEFSPEHVRGGRYKWFFERNFPIFPFCHRMPDRIQYILLFHECLNRPPHISFVGDYLN